MTNQNAKEFSQKKPKSAHARSWEAGRAAFKLIGQHKTSADSKSYAVWYAYTTKSNPDLQAALDSILSRADGVSSAEMLHLHETYIAETGEAEEKLESISQAIQSKVAGANSLVTEVIWNTSEYVSSMDRAKERIPSASSPDEIIGALDEIIEHTKSSQESAENIQVALQSTQEEILDLSSRMVQIRDSLRRDPLTDLINRQKFEATLEENMAVAFANGYSLTVLVARVKNLQDLSLTAGMDISEFVIKSLAGFMTKTVGDNGVCARLDGSDLAIMLPKYSYAEAGKIAKAIIEELDQFKIVKKPDNELVGYIRCAFGGSALQAGLTAADLVGIATDQASLAKFANKSHVKFNLTNHQVA